MFKNILTTLFATIFALFLCLLITLSFIYYKKLNFWFEMGPKFSRFDESLGWTLASNKTSYQRGKSILTGEIYFDAEVFTSPKGFRSSKIGKLDAINETVSIGDSWTFGYCVPYEHTYQAYLENLLGSPVINMGVPAYGSGSVYGLFEKHVKDLKPKRVIYINWGLSDRSAYTVENKNMIPKDILIPTFYYSKSDDEVFFKYPKKGDVFKFVSKNVYPGGSLTAGYDFWSYMFFVKPKQILELIDNKLDLKIFNFKGMSKIPGLKVGITPEIADYEMKLYKNLQDINGFEFIFYDGYENNIYKKSFEKYFLNNNNYQNTYVSVQQWNKEVFEKGEEINLTQKEKRVPHDGHFGKGLNKLIAEMFFNRIDLNGDIQ